jgi:hypothetical protein
MAQQNIDFGAFPDDPAADAIRTAFQKVQTNFDQLFGANSDSTVTSINRTPGAGVTVNYPTGNVVISANIACLQVSTTSLRMGIGADNTRTNATVISSSQILNIDIDPNVVLSNTFSAPGNALATLNGTLSPNSFYQPYINTVGTLSGLSVSGNLTATGNASFSRNVSFTGSNINLGSIANLHIQGGTAGYYLQTNGAGNLLWAAAGGGNGGGTPGGTNTQVQFNNEGAFLGVSSFTFDKLTGLLTVPSANIGNIIGAFANGNSNLNIPAVDGNVNISVNGNANVLIVTDVGANITGNLNVDDKILANRIEGVTLTGTITTNAQPNITSVGTLTGLTVSSNTSSTPVTITYTPSTTLGSGMLVRGANTQGGTGYFDILKVTNQSAGATTPNKYFRLNPTGNLQIINSSYSTTIFDLSDSGALTNLSSLSVTGNANVGNIGTVGLITATGNLTAGNIITNGIVTATGNVSGGNLTTTGLITVTGNLNAGNIITGGIISATGNANVGNIGSNNVIATTLSVSGNANVGNLGTGGLITATGNISGSNITTIGQLVSSLAVGTPPIVVVSTTEVANLFVYKSNIAGYVTAAAQGNITSLGTLLSLSVSGNANIGNIGTAGSITATGNANVGNIGANNAIFTLITGTLVTAAQPNITSVGTLTSISVSGNANVGNLGTAGLITATGNINGANITGTHYGAATGLTGIPGANVSGQVGNALVAGTVYTAAQPNITSVGTLTSLGVNGTVTAVAFTANTGVFTGNGSGLSQLAGANVTGTVANATYAVSAGSAGSATTAGTVTTAAQPNITSVGTLTSLSVSGNITAGNISATNHTGTTANLTGQYITTLATGTAPFVVTSTTQVANLNVATAGLATYATTANAVAGANVSGTVANANYSVYSGTASIANSVAAANISGTVNLANYATTANSVAGANVTGAVAFATTANSVAGANVSGTVANATYAVTAGTAYSVSAGNISGTVNLANYATTANSVAGANVSGAVAFATTANSVAGANVTGTVANATYAVSAGSAGSAGSATSATTAGTVTTAAQPNITSVGTLTSLTVSGALTTTNITTGANTTAGTLTGNWTLSTGSRMQATYADLAEYYAGSEQIEPGTVVEFGGEHEVQICNSYMSTLVAGIVTTDPAYVMNSGINCTYPVAIALQGRIPVKVIGPVKRGDMMVSSNNGHAVSCQSPNMGTVLGKSLVDFTGESGVIEIMVGRT